MSATATGTAVVARAREIVGDADADIGLVAGRQRGGRIGREHEIAAHRGGSPPRADQVGRHRHRHHAQLAVEIVRHRVLEILLAVHVDDAGPVDHRLVALALEGIELAPDRVAAVAARRRRGHQLLEVGQDEVEDLRRLHVEHALAEEELQRIAELVVRDLQDAFVHREHHDARGLCRMQLEGGGRRPA